MAAVRNSPPLIKRKKCPWWVCPSNRELSLRSKIQIGYSTIASRADKNRHAPILGSAVPRLSVNEISSITSVLARAEAVERINELRIGSLKLEYENLKASCLGDGIQTCRLCGYDQALNQNLNVEICDSCNMLSCEKCYHKTVLHSGRKITLCKVCSDFQELWCKSGAWMHNMIPKSTVSKQEVENWNATLCVQLQEERKSIDVYQLLSEDKIRVNIEAEESSTDDDDDITDDKLNTLSSYKDIRFNDGNISDGTSRCSTPESDILGYSCNQEKLLKDVEGKPRRSFTLDSALRKKSSPTTMNSTGSLEHNQIRGRFLNRSPSPLHSAITQGNFENTGSNPSTDSEFEPFQIQQLQNIDKEASIIPSIVVSNDNRFTSSSEEEPSDDQSSEHEEIPRTYTFERFNITRAPRRTQSSHKRKPLEGTVLPEPDETTNKEDDDLNSTLLADIVKIEDRETIEDDIHMSQGNKYSFDSSSSSVNDSPQRAPIQSPNRDSTEIQSPNRDSTGIQSPNRDSTGIQSPNRDSTEIQSPTTDAGTPQEDTTSLGNDSPGYKWRRRNATKSASSGAGSITKDKDIQQKREKARLAAQRIRERHGGSTGDSHSRKDRYARTKSVELKESDGSDPLI